MFKEYYSRSSSSNLVFYAQSTIAVISVRIWQEIRGSNTMQQRATEGEACKVCQESQPELVSFNHKTHGFRTFSHFSLYIWNSK